MTPYELAKSIHVEISPFAPRLSAAINRALIDIGEGSVLVGLGPGTNENDQVSFQEVEQIRVSGCDAETILSKINEMLWKLETHSSWKVIVDRKPQKDKNKLELLYTLFRMKDGY